MRQLHAPGLGGGRGAQALDGTMSYLRRLLGVELAAQAALASCAILLSIGVAAAAVFVRDRSVDIGWDVLNSIAFIALLAYLYSVVAVALVIAPAYALIEAMGRANPMTAAFIGLLPGLAFLLYRVTPFAVFDGSGPFLELACMATGASVAMAIHLVRTWSAASMPVPSNKSLERSRER